ncbi:1-acyl-sn-glycerol-3-phosphate acyltransferase [Eubacteriales bacterium OttesenSCG-928-N14]|nr:1-acyl-sn-glycerol-3-phosphate acyltransferase [Eubacteriales bacterium OttesenSCG-928-N14]
MGQTSKTVAQYSFDGDQLELLLGEPLAKLAQLGVDLTDRQQLKGGIEHLVQLQYTNLPDFDANSYILAPNHISNFDALILGLLHADMKIVSKAEWVQSRELMRFLGQHYDLIGIDRSSKINQARALVGLVKYLNAATTARHVLIFPQGTISDINKNSLERVQSGVFYLSEKTGVPILPIFLEQPSFDGPTRVVFGQPMHIAAGEDGRKRWRDAVIALQDGLDPPARAPMLNERHTNNNQPGDPFF